MAKFKIHCEFNNQAERDIIIINSKKSALAVMEFFISENKNILSVCLLSKWDEEMQSFEGVKNNLNVWNL